MIKTALVTGFTRQDGPYLTEILLKKGYEIHGLPRKNRSSNSNIIDHVIGSNKYADYSFPNYRNLMHSSILNRLLELIKPQIIYNLGAQNHVKVSFQIPGHIAQIGSISTLRILYVLKETIIDAKFYQAHTNELFGKTTELPQNENTPFYSKSFYGAAKSYAYWTVFNYIEACNIFVAICVF